VSNNRHLNVTSAELHHNCFRVGVARVLNEVLELVKVIVDRPSTLKVQHGFQHVHGCGFGIEGHEVFLELLFKIDPVDEAEVSGLCSMFKFAGRLVACTSGFHVGHCPDDLGEIIFEGFRAEADVGSAGRQECLACGTIAIKLRGIGRLKKILFPSGGGSRYRWGLGAATGQGQIRLGTFRACVGLSLSRMSCKSLWVASF